MWSLVPVRWFASAGQAFAFSVVYLLWMLSEVVLRTAVNWRHGSAGGVPRDRGSFRVIVLAMGLTIAGAFWARAILPATLAPGWFFAGTTLMAAGIALRGWAVLTLGPFFSPVVRVAQHHELVTAGPYRLIRHPAYAGGLLTSAGLPLALRTEQGAVLVVLFVFAAHAYRIRVEERALLESGLGEAYREYARRTWRLLPWVW